MSILTMHHGLTAGIKQGDPPGYVTIGGRLYRTVTIGTQTWLAENLDYKASGITIAAEGTPTTPAAWYYNNDESTYGEGGSRECGLLYNWYAAKYLNDNRSTFFNGWHVPSRAEFETLVSAVGGASSALGKLRAQNVPWAPTWGGTDDYGFGLLPSGLRYYNFGDIGNQAYMWSITPYNSSNSYDAHNGNEMRTHEYIDNFTGHSIRLVKDA